MKNILLKSMAVMALAVTTNVALANVPDPEKASAGMIGRHETNGGVDLWVEEPADGIYTVDTWAKDANAYDSQFFLVISDELLPVGTPIEISFDFTAEEDTVTFNAQGHKDPHSYANNNGWPNLTAVPGVWKSYSAAIADCNGDSDIAGVTTGELRTLAVNASIAKKDATLKLANIVIKVNNKAVVKTKAVETGATAVEVTTPETPETPAEPVVETDLQEWVISDSTKISAVFEQVSGVTIRTTGCSDSWNAQFNPPTWFTSLKKEGKSFKISFDAKFVGGEGSITFNQGDAMGSIDFQTADTAALFEALGFRVEKNWMIQGKMEQLIVDSSACSPIVIKDGKSNVSNAALNRNVTFYPTDEWQSFVIAGTIGKHGLDSVDIAVEFGKVNGTYGLRNFVFEVDGKEFASYFVVSSEGSVAVEEVAAINAYVAGGVLYASEAVDVVIYNISGVAVKVAKNVTTLNVADLKSGLYIAKVGNKAIKFVK